MRLEPDHSPSRIGTVEDVNGTSVSIRIDQETPNGILFINGEAFRAGQVGGFVRIPAGYVDIYAVITQVGAGAAPFEGPNSAALGNRWLRVELVGETDHRRQFERGISQYPTVGSAVHVVTEGDLQTMYAPHSDERHVAIGRLAGASSVKVQMDVNKLLNRHSAIVGSTGAGKSNAVATLLGAMSAPETFPGARIVLFDIHGEYGSAFGELARVFRIGARSKFERELSVPYWALTGEEFISLSMGNIGGTQLALVQEQIIAAKRKSQPAKKAHGMHDSGVTMDTPLPFSIRELWLELFNLHHGTHTVSKNQNQTEQTRAYEGGSSSAGDADSVQRPRFKALLDRTIYAGNYSELPRTHLEVLESKLRDPRLNFLYRPGDWDVSKNCDTKKDLDALLEEWVGSDAPISVFDLSAVPASILDDMIGVILRILYDAMFWGRANSAGARQRPLMLVLEEAHTYLGAQSKGRASAAGRRIAKEGRKYGVGLMIVSQRPAELDATILSQCGTFVTLRLSNEADRAQVSACASDNLKGLFSVLPVLRTGEALIVGEAVNIPVRTLLDRRPSGYRPSSEDPAVAVPFDSTGKRVRTGGWTQNPDGEDYSTLVREWRDQKST